MGQYWLLCNLTRGKYVYCGASKLSEFSSWSVLHRNIVRALRPGGTWSGHRMLFTGDYDDNQAHARDYLAANGLAFLEEEAEDKTRPNLFHLCSDGALSGTNDRYALGWNTERELLPSVFGELGLTGGRAVGGGPASGPTVAEANTAVSHDAKQRLRLSGLGPWNAFICLLAESSGGGGGDIEAHFGAQWAAQRIAIVPEAEADALGYEDIAEVLLTPAWLSSIKEMGLLDLY
jgi:hypothetical protein